MKTFRHFRHWQIYTLFVSHNLCRGVDWWDNITSLDGGTEDQHDRGGIENFKCVARVVLQLTDWMSVNEVYCFNLWANRGLYIDAFNLQWTRFVSTKRVRSPRHWRRIKQLNHLTFGVVRCFEPVVWLVECRIGCMLSSRVTQLYTGRCKMPVDCIVVFAEALGANTASKLVTVACEQHDIVSDVRCGRRVSFNKQLHCWTFSNIA